MKLFLFIFIYYFFFKWKLSESIEKMILPQSLRTEKVVGRGGCVRACACVCPGGKRQILENKKVEGSIYGKRENFRRRETDFRGGRIPG